MVCINRVVSVCVYYFFSVFKLWITSCIALGIAISFLIVEMPFVWLVINLIFAGFISKINLGVNECFFKFILITSGST